MTHSRITKCFNQLAAAERRALIPYIMAGDPHPEATLPLMHTLVENGGDLIELGVPFSDPMADGPVIQAASERALQHRTNLHAVFAMVREFRRSNGDTPVVLMTYQNPIEAMGQARFIHAARAAGVDGVLVVDLPIEEAAGLLAAVADHALDLIFLVSPTTSPQRLRLIAQRARGFIYYVSLKGVTGAKHIDLKYIAAKVGEFKQTITLPLAVGFGIHDAESAARVAAIADGVVVGSAIVKLVAHNKGNDCCASVGAFIGELRGAMDAATAHLTSRATTSRAKLHQRSAQVG